MESTRTVEQPEYSILIHILLYNSVRTHGETVLAATIQSALDQAVDFQKGKLSIVVSDNGSDDPGIAPFQERDEFSEVTFRRFEENIGFSAGQNRAIYEFLPSRNRYLLLLNPDCKLLPGALKELALTLDAEPTVGSVCPKLLKTDVAGESLIDSVGMTITPDLRHFDTGSGEVDRGQYNTDAYVFGASGACVLLRREFIESLTMPTVKQETAVYSVFPVLAKEQSLRTNFFDEAFFAYREDADIAWRGQLFGWRCKYVHEAIGIHLRVVHPENRSVLPPELNQHGVRNRFLLQWNNYFPLDVPGAIFRGLLLRNLLVIAGVMLQERSSLPAFRQCLKLFRRAQQRQKYILEKAGSENRRQIKRWFCREPFREKE